MIAQNLFRTVFLFLCLFLGGTVSSVHAQSQDFEPKVGQQGKDVIWVPTPQDLVEKMLDMAKVTPKDYVIDLGSGDGRTVIAAAKRGAKALGIEYNAKMVELAQRAAARAGVADKATFVKADLFQSDFSRAQVISMFLLSSINLKLRPKILDLKPGTRIVSNTFDMGDWRADQSVRLPGCHSWCTAHLWIVPAKVEGTWKLAQGALRLRQSFQNISGTLRTGDTEKVLTGKLDGYRISFNAGGRQYDGRVSGTRITGTSNGTQWMATRMGR